MSILNANTKNTTTAVQAAIVQSRGLRERDARGGGERESRFGDGDREPGVVSAITGSRYHLF
eukprot:m.507753 g.507753  ORF g.507753 m.507753 type:complete len:62 (+) comp21881_c0_seq15:2950-3135(+)